VFKRSYVGLSLLHWHSLTLTNTRWHSVTLVDTHWHSLTLVDTHWHSLTLTDTRWHSLTLTDTRWHLLTLADTHWHSLTLTDTRWHPLTLTDTHWHSLTLTDTPRSLVGPTFRSRRWTNRNIPIAFKSKFCLGYGEPHDRCGSHEWLSWGAEYLSHTSSLQPVTVGLSKNTN
jgi:hypothetical protein